MISYQSRLSLQSASHKSVALDYEEVRWKSGNDFVQTCKKDICAKKSLCSGDIRGRNACFAHIYILTISV